MHTSMVKIDAHTYYLNRPTTGVCHPSRYIIYKAGIPILYLTHGGEYYAGILHTTIDTQE